MKLSRFIPFILLIVSFILFIVYYIVVILYPQISDEKRTYMLLPIMIIPVITIITMTLKKEGKLTISSILGVIPLMLFIVYFIVVSLYPQISFERNMSMLFVIMAVVVISFIIPIKHGVFKNLSKQKIIILFFVGIVTIILSLTSYWRAF